MAEEMQGASRNWEFHSQAPKLSSFGQEKGFLTAVSHHSPLPCCLLKFCGSCCFRLTSSKVLPVSPPIKEGERCFIFHIPSARPLSIPYLCLGWALLAMCLELEQSHAPEPALCPGSRAALQIRAVPPALRAELLSGAFCSYRLLTD